MQKTVIKIQGMTCVNCAMRIEKGLSELNGVDSANVNVIMENAVVTYNPDSVSLKQIHRAIEELGYKVKREEKRQPLYKLYFSASASIIIMLSDFNFPPLRIIPHNTLMLAVFALATIVQFWSGWQFYVGFYHALKNRSADMNVLVAIGTSSAYLYSAISMFVLQHHQILEQRQMYYDTSAVIITFILLGKFLESRAKKSAGSSIANLIRMQPNSAAIITDTGEEEISIDEINVGDVALVKPGETIPVDGTIVDGSASINESMITGESIPTEKHAGNDVVGGTLNIDGVLKIKVTKTGKDTVLSKIIAVVEQAQTSKAPIQKLADRFASVFVPVILITALSTLVIWFIFGKEDRVFLAVSNAIAVLIIACPCAMGLATPTAVSVGIGRGAKEGILIKNAETLELSEKIQTVVFDKTGTLTKGLPKVSNIVGLNGYSSEEALSYSASIEAMSEHPIAKAVVQKANESGVTVIPAQDFRNVSGFGATGMVNGKSVIVGKEKFLREKNTDFGVFTTANKIASSSVFVSIGGVLAGIIYANDEIKENARETVAKLKSLGLKTGMVTGDNKFTADYVAESVGTDFCYSEITPIGKAEIIKQLQATGKVAIVGDGINDAPALSQADIGIAMGSGTDIAIETGSIILTKSNIGGVIDAIILSRKMIKIIRQNLFWAFFYNVIAIPVAAGVFYPAFGLKLSPTLASLAMAMSSVSVVLNSLRLKFVKIHVI